MRHGYFHVKNFKGIEDVKIELDKRPASRIFTLVGLNESGKTTILEAIDFLESKLQGPESSAIHGYSIKDVHQLIPRSQKDIFNGDIVIEASYRLDDDDKQKLTDFLWNEFRFEVKQQIQNEFTVELRYSFHNSIVVEKDPSIFYSLEIYGKTRNAKNVKALDGERWRTMISFLKSLMPVVVYFPNFLFEFPDRVYLENPPGDLQPEKYHFYRNVFEDVLSAVNPKANLDEHVIARVRSETKSVFDIFSESLESMTGKMGTHVSKTIFSYWNKIFKDEVVGKEIEIRAFKEPFEDAEGNENHRIYFRIRLKEGSEFCSISERSLGFRWFFAFLLFTRYRGSREGRNILFLFDEPASNLHSSAQSQLLECFEDYSENSSVIYTTHSHHLINPEWLEGAFVVKNTGLTYEDTRDYFSPITKVTLHRYREFVGSYPEQTTYFQPILDVLDYRPSALEHIPDVVMLEGKNDFYTLKYINDIIIGKKPKLNFLPGGGAGSLDQPIQLYLGWGRNFVVLVDSDTEGRKQKARYIEKFGGLVEGRIFSLEDIDKRWKGLSMESLFTANEQLKVQKLAVPSATTFNKTHFNRAVQEAYLTETALKLNKTTIEKFQKLVEFLMNQLGT